MDISAIKQQLSIGQVLEHYNIKVKNNQCCCPFHDDKTPSMQVYPKTNTVHCFSGNCDHAGKAIDQIDFIMHHEKCSKHEAILKAKTMASSAHYLVPTAKEKAQTTPVHHNSLFNTLRQSLSRSKAAQNYLKERGLPYEAALEIGYKPPSNKTFKGMNHCLIFPLKNSQGERGY